MEEVKIESNDNDESVVLKDIGEQEISTDPKIRKRVIEAMAALQQAIKYDDESPFSGMCIRPTSASYIDKCRELGLVFTTDTEILGKSLAWGYVGVALIIDKSKVHKLLNTDIKYYESSNYWRSFFYFNSRVVHFLTQEIYTFVIVLPTLDKIESSTFYSMERKTMFKSLEPTLTCKSYNLTINLVPFHSAYDRTIYEIWIPSPYNLCINTAYTVIDRKELNIFSHDQPRLQKNEVATDIEVSVEFIEECFRVGKLKQQLEIAEEKLLKDKYTVNLLNDEK